jgi:hypothetical protein
MRIEVSIMKIESAEVAGAEQQAEDAMALTELDLRSTML